MKRIQSDPDKKTDQSKSTSKKISTSSKSSKKTSRIKNSNSTNVTISINQNGIDISKYHIGHRTRVRDKFLKLENLESFAPYELVEVLLFYCNKRSDVKNLAKDIDLFFNSSIHKMLNCDLEAFKKNFKGLGDSFYCLLKLIKELQRRNIYEKVQPRFELNNLNDLVDYLRVFYNQQTTEIFKAIFLDSKSKILEDKILSYGTTNQAIVYPREIVKLALEKNAAYVIIVHNHPSGDPTPSREDFSITLEIKSALKTVGISLFDSLIITYDSFYSFKKDGLI